VDWAIKEQTASLDIDTQLLLEKYVDLLQLR
jgi:hypothetical protein